MFDRLSQRLETVLDKLRGRGVLGEDDVDAALREVRMALLEADVALPVAKEFVQTVREAAIGQNVVRSVSPGQMVVKIVHDALVNMLGGEVEDPRIRGSASLAIERVPAPILMVGLQGSGKTTTTAKIGVQLAKQHRKKVLLASLDVYRPAAQDQLAILGKQASLDTLPVIVGEQPVAIAKRALDSARKGGYDVVLLDTAGRLHIDDTLMDEVASVRDAVNPTETLLVADAMMGQDAVVLAREFNEKVGVTGLVLTRVDGDARGGAALSMRAVTGCPIKFLGVGEKVDALEAFHPERIASRILGMGDVVSLVEKAAATFEQEEAEKLATRMMAGRFDLADMLSQIRQLRKMGDVKGLLGMLPGLGKLKKQIDTSGIDDRAITRQEAIILSMTPQERHRPDLLKASRKRRVAAGAGVTVTDVNRLLKQYQQMAGMMKKMKTAGGKGMLNRLLGGMPGGDMGAALGSGNVDLSSLSQQIPPDMFGGGSGHLPPDVLRALSHKGKKGR